MKRPLLVLALYLVAPALIAFWTFFPQYDPSRTPAVAAPAPVFEYLKVSDISTLNHYVANGWSYVDSHGTQYTSHYIIRRQVR